jgi:hypothetical protein
MTENISLNLISFADGRMENAKVRLEKQAREMSVFQTISVGSDEILEPSFLKRHKNIMSERVRGYGYWVWKPHIIQRALQKLKDGEFLLYLDVGCHLNHAGRDRLLEYCNLINKENTQFMLVFQLGDEFTDSCWTKGDLFDYFDARDLAYITHTPQIQSGVILFRKCAAALKFVQDWQDVFDKDIHLVDDSESKSKNFAGFVEHRHDQSAFSILSKLTEAKILAHYEVYPIDGSWLSMAKYPINMKRDKELKSPLSQRVTAKFKKYFKK